jgi:site-specific recombinase XerD
MIKVFLREKKLLHGKKGLYLDYYPPVADPRTGKATRREHLKLYIYERPKTEGEKTHNKETRMLGENIKARRQLELQAGTYGFDVAQHRRKDFLEYVKSVCDDKKKTSYSNQGYWRTIYNHLVSYSRGPITFSDVTETFCRRFKDYLAHDAGLSNNTASAYFDSFKAIVKSAAERRLLRDNPVKKVQGIKTEERKREYLTLDEVRRLAGAECHVDQLKRAALFSAMTGLRFSDISKLTWAEVQQSSEQGVHLRFRQQKTGGVETLPISDEAASLLGDRRDRKEKVFNELQKWHCSYYLQDWLNAAGIHKKITFHCFRHTFATLQLSLGTDIYTLSRMLGHTDVKTTAIYANIIDETKRRAANRITLK